MKLELVKEESLTKSPWYTVTLNGEYKFGSWDHQDALNVFNTLLKDVKALDVRKEILKSEEVDVSLEPNQTS
jgi:hypothetical protein